jgi:hypothetical protein
VRPSTTAISRLGLIALAIGLCVALGLATPAAGQTAGSDGLQRLTALDRQYRVLLAIRPACASTRADRARARSLRGRAIRDAGAAGPAGLRARATLLRRAVAILRRAPRVCVRPPAAPPAPVAGIASVPASLPPVPMPPGTGPGGPATIPLTLASLLKGDVFDLTEQLGGFQLPAALGALGLGQLDDRSCRGVAAICLGLDRPVLNEQMRDLINRNGVTLALGNLTALNLPGLLTQVDLLLDQGDLATLIRVERLDDRVLRLTPIGALAELAGLPDVPDVVVGRLQVAGVFRCPPAEVGGLPRVCIA